MIPVTTFAGKTVAVFGLGGSGLATCHALIAGGAELRAFPQPVMDACYQATQDHLNEMTAKSPLFKKTKESHDAYMKEVLSYTQIAENYYDNYLLGKMRKG